MQYPLYPFMVQATNLEKRVKFSQAEDQLLSKLVTQLGQKSWNLISKMLPGRTSRQCRDRWNHYLSPQINISSWTAEEDALLIEKIHEYGKQWSKIATFFPGRTGISIRNHCCKLSRQPHSDALLKQILSSTSLTETIKDESCEESNENCATSPEPEMIRKLPSCMDLIQMVNKTPHFYKLSF